MEFNTKTMILPRPETEPEAETGGASDFDEMEKTMILTTAKPKPDCESEFDRMEKTIIMSPPETSQPTADFFEEDDDLDKTMIIPPKTRH